MKTFALFPALLFCTALVAACSSPLDLDTPRERIIEQEAGKDRVPLKGVRYICNDPGSEGVLFDAEGWSGEADTVTGRLWLTGAWTLPSASRGSVPLTRFLLTLDSAACDGTDHGITDGAGKDNGVLTVYFPPLVFSDQEFYPDGSTTLVLRLTRDPVHRRITGDVTAHLDLIRPIETYGILEVDY